MAIGPWAGLHGHNAMLLNTGIPGSEDMVYHGTRIWSGDWVGGGGGGGFKANVFA